IVDNTTAHLIADLDRLRLHLGIDRWLLFGGSWGSTLALAYAEAYPERVSGLVLRGVFLASRAEIDWFMRGMRHLFPEAWRAFARIEAHYFIHGGFFADGELIDNVSRIRHLPCTIVQGRYDVICPPVTADALARAWPEAEYIVVPDAGHSVREPGITRELLAAVKRMQTQVAGERRSVSG